MMVENNPLTCGLLMAIKLLAVEGNARLLGALGLLKLLLGSLLMLTQKQSGLLVLVGDEATLVVLDGSLALRWDVGLVWGQRVESRLQGQVRRHRRWGLQWLKGGMHLHRDLVGYGLRSDARLQWLRDATRGCRLYRMVIRAMQVTLQEVPRGEWIFGGRLRLDAGVIRE